MSETKTPPTASLTMSADQVAGTALVPQSSDDHTYQLERAPSSERYLRFQVGAQIVFHLGRDLISDASQAVVELVKNSYDADATWAVVEIDAAGVPPGGRFQSATGWIMVADNGSGMTIEDIQLGWLTIAKSRKRGFKERRQVTRLGRTPVGDKGLGRLGAQALAENVHILSRPAGTGLEVEAWFSWRAFAVDVELSSVPINYEVRERQAGAADGTMIVLSDLVNPRRWSEQDADRYLQERVGSLVSPFAGVERFQLLMRLNGVKIDLIEVATRIRQAALTRYTFEFDGEVLTVHARARLQYCKPNPNGADAKKKAMDQFNAFVMSDAGATLFHHLFGKAKKDGLTLEAGEDGWFVTARGTYPLKTLDKHALDPAVSVEQAIGAIPPANPGPFRGEIDYFNIADRDEGLDLFSLRGELKRVFQRFSGIHVYRDGFGIPLNSDWLRLSDNATKGGSYYELRPGNTMGFVALSSRDNALLRETSDRQRFVTDDAHYRNFELMLMAVVRFAGRFQEALRRGTTEFVAKEAAKAAGVAKDGGGDVAEKMDAFVADAKAGGTQLQGARVGAVGAVKSAEAAAQKKRGRKSLSDEDKEALAALETAVAALKQSEIALASAQSVLSRVDDVVALRGVLEDRLLAYAEQMDLAYETIGLGIAAEVLAHEVDNIAQSLTDRAAAYTSHLRATGVKDQKCFAFGENVRSTASALKLQTRHLGPSLRYVRERRDLIDLHSFLNEFRSYHQGRLERKRIELEVRWASDLKYSIEMNKGKLTQVLDNLVVNAEYWVSEALRTRSTTTGLIEVVAEPPVLLVRDNGPGVDESIEDALFRPFMTRKSRGEGRGLGLFIAQQIMESEGCSLELLPVRNTRGRRYVFQLDLSGVMTNANRS